MLPNPMGDAILATPALRRLRRAFPDAHIMACGRKSATAILQDHPALDGLDCFDDGACKGMGTWAIGDYLQRWKYEAALILPNSLRAALIAHHAKIPRRIGYDRDRRGFLLTTRIRPFRLQHGYAPVSMLDYYGWLTDHAIEALGGCSECPYYDDDNSLSLGTSFDDGEVVDKMLSEWEVARSEHYAILVPGGAFGKSKWWPVDRFAKLGRQLHDNGYKIVLLCAPSDAEREIERRFSEYTGYSWHSTSAASLSLGGVKELVRRAELMIANDTGPCHIAAAFKVPLVTLFGPTDPRWTATGYDREIRLRVDVDCGPCQKPVCETDHRCLEQIDVERVYQASQRALHDGFQPGRSIQIGRVYAVYDESFVPLVDGSGLVHQQYRELLKQNGLSRLSDFINISTGERLEKAGLGRRERLRLTLQPNDGDPVVVYLKRFDAGSLGGQVSRWLKRRVRTAEGLIEFDAALSLAEHDIPVARPLAYGFERGGIGGRRSFVLTEELPQADALERLLPRLEESQQKYRLLGDRQRLINEAALLVRRMHEKGYFHRDLYLSHLFVCKEWSGREYLAVIDLQRLFRPIWRKRRWRVKDLAQLLYSAQSFFSPTEQMRFMRIYLGVHRLSGEQKALVRSVLRKCERIAAHDARKRQREATA